MQVNDLVAAVEVAVRREFWEKRGFEGLKERSFWAVEVAAAAVGGSLMAEEMALSAAEAEEAAIWRRGNFQEREIEKVGRVLSKMKE